ITKPSAKCPRPPEVPPTSPKERFSMTGAYQKFRGLFPSFPLDRKAFAGDEDRGGRRDVEDFRVVALIDADANAAARVDIQKGFTDGDFHERLDVREGDRLLVELYEDFVAEAIAELLEIVARNIGDQRSIRIVEPDNGSLDAFLGGNSE